MPPMRLPQYMATVVSTNMKKSAVVVTDTWKWHAKVGKLIKQRKRMTVHDENEVCSLGDKVLIEAAGRRLSATKTFVVKDVVKKVGVLPEFMEQFLNTDPVHKTNP
ncbi:hypothetical protein WA158_004165 [Blastocystis sp. Blastoise]